MTTGNVCLRSVVGCLFAVELLQALSAIKAAAPATKRNVRKEVSDMTFTLYSE